MSHLTEEIRKQAILLQTGCYHIERIVRIEFDDCLKVGNPNTDANVTRLNQLGNIDKLCTRIRQCCEEIEICLGIAEDMEASDEDSGHRRQTAEAQASGQ